MAKIRPLRPQRILSAVFIAVSLSPSALAQVAGPSLAVSPPVPTSGKFDVDNGVSFTVQLQATGGKTPYSFSATGVPPGLSLNSSTGFLAGQPNVTGAYTVVAKVTDANNATATISIP